MVNALSEQQTAAQLFLTEFVATEEIMLELVKGRGSPSTFIPVLEGQIEDDSIAGFAEAGENAVLMPAIPEMASVWGAWASAHTLIIQGSEDPETAYRNAAEQIRTFIAESK